MASSKALLIKLKIPNRVQPEVIPSPGCAGQYTNKMDFMKRYLLDELSKKTFAVDFMQPVDTEALQVPTYYTIIQWPMDIGSINKRLQHRYYHGVDELIRDFRLVISNCYRFNRPEDTVYHNGKKLEKFFHKVLAKLPVGDEFACNNFVLTELVPRESELISADTERLCRSELKRLQNNYTDKVDLEIRDFFKHKWSSLSKKLSKHQFETAEQFHSQVDGIFLKYRNHAKNIYNNTYNECLEQIEHQKASKELSELLYSLKKTVQQYTNPQARWEDSLIVGLDMTVNILRKQLETYRLEHEEEEMENMRDAQVLAEQRRYKERCALNKSQNCFKNNILPESPPKRKANMDMQLAHISEAERREIQQQFIMLPLNSKIEIMQMVACTENISTTDSDLQWFDISNFNSNTLNIMKNAMHPHTKLNLRNMNPIEKVNLQRSLEIRLQSINYALNTNRRKYTPRPRFCSVPNKRQRFSSSASKDFSLERKLQAGAGPSSVEQPDDESQYSSDSESDSSSSSSSDSSSESSSNSEDNKSS